MSLRQRSREGGSPVRVCEDRRCDYTRWRRALGRSAIWRYYAIVVTADGRDLNELLVSAGLARIYGTRTPLPDGRDSPTYLAHLHELENEARAANRGAWGKVHR
jgi:endonuclease YncB( thermonuclease family)